VNKITTHILKLICENDCVIVPEFGGFVAQYSSAKLDNSTGFFAPPFRQILFNKNLINNDGLLANSVAQAENISFSKATELINNEVEEIKRNLALKKQIIIKGIGLIYTHENSIKFKQNSENILKDSFGLKPININEFFNENIKDTKVVPISTPNNTGLKKWWIAAAIVPLIFYSAWIPLKTNLFSEKTSFHYSDLNPFTFSKEKKYFPENLFNLKGDVPIIKTDLEENQPEPKNTLQFNTLENKAPDINLKINRYKYHVIVGCFGNNKNSKKLISKLTKKGINAFELDIHKNLHRVSAGSFTSKEKAKMERNQLKFNQGISSWVLKK
tara:strand:- start:1737 stop:2720 length:984 start_codon:yes stop_codon:yes gene_type:complete